MIQNEQVDEQVEERAPISSDQIEEIRNAAIERAKRVTHSIKQRGPYLVCTSCDYPHTLLHIGVNKRLTGIAKDGSPILEDLKR